MSTHGVTGNAHLETDRSWTSQASLMTIPDADNSSTPTANSLDETFSPSENSFNSFITNSSKSEVLEGDGREVERQSKEEERVESKKKKGVTLVYCPERKAANIFESSRNSTVSLEPGEKEITIRSNHIIDINYDGNNSITKEEKETELTSSIILNESIHPNEASNHFNINDENQVIESNDYRNLSDDKISSKRISIEYKGPSLSNNNLSDDSKRNDSISGVVSTSSAEVLTSLHNNSLPVLSTESKSSSKEILNNLKPFDNVAISVNDENDSVNLQDYDKSDKTASLSIGKTERYTSAFRPVLSSQPLNNLNESHQESKQLLTDNSFIESNLGNIAQMNLGLDDEVSETVVNISDQHKKTISRFREQAVIPTYLDRCSPAQIVAVTGGAPADIIRNIEEDLDDDNDDRVIEVLSRNREGVLGGGDSNASSTNSDNVVRHRDHISESSKFQKPVTINIDLRVVSHLTPSTPEEVDASSELVFSNFMIDRYMLEVSASAKASSQCNTSASATVNISSQQVMSDDPVSHQLSSLPRAEPHSVEAIVAHNLAEIGDEINRIYGPRLDRMIKLLPVEECPLEMFYNVARVLFARGPTNWGQVITLFYFGYRLVVQRVKKGIANAFYQVCRCLVSFCRKINIFVWIAQQGGWQILQFLHSARTCDASESMSNDPSHFTTRPDIEQSHQNTLLNNNSSPDVNDSRLFIPLVLTSTSFVVIAFALWICMRR
uniref:Bcl-2 homologous antagonist/killer (Apoptosis regulator BAK) n=1 Tax=Schistosoma japonicum TaxID=6182 RepID=C1L606_SCHJA|nr:Bcl-2 homologous antagonist/killer (Apoptosis regulator BAK) [Schistosoma japonicum]